MTKSNIFSAVFGAALALSGAATAGTITPNIIFGTGNVNRGFTVETSGNIELGLRAKLQYGPDGPNDEIGVGIIQNSDGAYLFDSDISTAPGNRAMWNFDWSIFSNAEGTGEDLRNYNYDPFQYRIGYDKDPTSGINMQFTAPLSWHVYCGTSATGNGAASETIGCAAGDTVAQQSVNYASLHFGGTNLLDGLYTISLMAFTTGIDDPILSVSIDVIVGSGVAAVPLPAGLPLLLAALGGLALLRRRKGVPQLAA